jgi:hypothetical protein
MVAVGPEERETAGRSVFVLLALLLSLLTAAPPWAGKLVNLDPVVTDAEALSKSAGENSRRAKPNELPALLGTNANIVTSLLFVRPARPTAAKFIERRATSLATGYNARAPPAPGI